MQDTNHTIERDIAEREQALAELKRMLLERERAMDELRQSIDESVRSIETLHGSINEQEHALSELRSAASRRAEEDAARALLVTTASGPDELRRVSGTLANAAYDPLLVLDANYNLVALNDAAARLLDAPDLLGQHISAVTHRSELELLLDDLLLNDEESLEEQMTFNKRMYRVKVTVNRGDPLLFGIGMQDVTDLVRLNRARRDMVANISHELRTPIANIRLVIESLFHEQDKPRRKESTSALRAIARETDSLLWLVQELLDLSMIESGQAILRMVETWLADIVNQAVERMEEQAELKDVHLVSNVPEDLRVLADSDQVKRVLLNLVHNAIKWSPSGGKITVSAEMRDDDVVVSVTDEGPGVPDDQTERIFERFYQVDPSRSKSDGTGLGLAICKHIVEAHGGAIWADGNSDGGGGRFRFTLPLA